MRHLAALPFGLAAMAALGACVEGTEVPTEPEPAAAAEYLGVRTMLLDDEMVNLRVAMKGAQSETEIEDYARCAAAQYALIRGYGFARHVRTQVGKTGNVWQGDAVYLISAVLPLGLKTIDAEVEVRSCDERSIPTV